MKPDFHRLLLIDDEPGIRRMMWLDLTADGYQVNCAEDGASGLESFAREKPDIVLTDLKMPGMDGIEVLRRIKEMSPTTEVIVITGHGDLDLAIQALQLDASDFITKPVNEKALTVALKRASERLRLRRELDSHTQDLEHRVSEATARVLAAERLAAVGQTVATLVHSLKNMLSGLKGGAYMVGQGLAGGQREIADQGLEMLGRNLARVSRLVGDLLTLSKPRQPELGLVDLEGLCAEAVATMLAEARTKEVELACLPGPGPLQASLEYKAVLDAMLNLISNAIDAASQVPGGRVEVRLNPLDGQACLEVSDNGTGLDPEAQGRIFQGFYSSKGAAGTGLGLMVCQKTASEHGGRLEFTSLPGQGATFRLILPLTPAPPRQCVPAGRPTNPAGQGPQAPDRGKER